MAGDIESLLDRKVQALKVGQCVRSMRTLREGGVALTEGSVQTLIVTVLGSWNFSRRNRYRTGQLSLGWLHVW